MSITLTVDGKVLGQKKPLFADWRVELPPLEGGRGDRLKLRELIRSIVAKEVEAFQTRQEERRVARLMSRAEIEQGVQRGRVDPGAHDLNQPVDLENAISVALQAFEDGLYFVFIDDVQQTQLDQEVFLRKDSRVLFLRLTALAGG